MGLGPRYFGQERNATMPMLLLIIALSLLRWANSAPTVARFNFTLLDTDPFVRYSTMVNRPDYEMYEPGGKVPISASKKTTYTYPNGSIVQHLGTPQLAVGTSVTNFKNDSVVQVRGIYTGIVFHGYATEGEGVRGADGGYQLCCWKRAHVFGHSTDDILYSFLPDTFELTTRFWGTFVYENEINMTSVDIETSMTIEAASIDEAPIHSQLMVRNGKLNPFFDSNRDWTIVPGLGDDSTGGTLEYPHAQGRSPVTFKSPPNSTFFVLNGTAMADGDNYNVTINPPVENVSAWADPPSLSWNFSSEQEFDRAGAVLYFAPLQINMTYTITVYPLQYTADSRLGIHSANFHLSTLTDPNPPPNDTLPNSSDIDNTTTTEPAPGNESDSNRSQNNVGAIAGGVVGGVLGTALIGMAVWLCMRRKRKSPPQAVQSDRRFLDDPPETFMMQPNDSNSALWTNKTEPPGRWAPEHENMIAVTSAELPDPFPAHAYPSQSSDSNPFESHSGASSSAEAPTTATEDTYETLPPADTKPSRSVRSRRPRVFAGLRGHARRPRSFEDDDEESDAPPFVNIPVRMKEIVPPSYNPDWAAAHAARGGTPLNDPPPPEH